jgi:predicted nuclease with RNAse H fold
MAKIVGMDGKPLVRQEVREMERDIAKNVGKIIPGIFQDMQFLGQRNDIIIEVLKIMGVTDEQFQQAVETVKAKYAAQEKPEAVQ